MWRITPMHRTEESGRDEEDGPPRLPTNVDTEELQPPSEGAGPLFHRRYGVRIRDPKLGPEELIERIAGDPNRGAPSEFARFQKTRGAEGTLQVGDEYLVRMPGPWDGPVRVVDRSPTSFRLATLAGHLEAGQIEFRAVSNGELEFWIESWARNGDSLSNLLYSHLRMAKEVQLHMWTSFLERVVKLSGGSRSGRLEVHTRRVASAEREWERLAGRPLNFDPARRAEYTAENGWRVDDVRTPLPRGSWEPARRVARNYDFAAPSIVEAHFDPEQPLEERNMLLVLHFYVLRFHAGVRVGEVYDRTEEVEGRTARVWGWNYQTLEGHVERGQMDWQIWKWLDSGEVEFRIRAFSQPAADGGPLVRLGFRIFGRREQLKFLRRTSERMARLVAAEMRRA
jgi:uncharacterized protein (UPF0548 family)